MLGSIFYGWWVVLACGIIALWAGTMFYGLTAFIDPLVKEMQWSYLAVSLAASLRSVEIGLGAPLAGYLTDRLGPRRVAFASGLICGTGFLCLSAINTLPQFYIAFFVLFMGFSGMGHSVVTTALANWFHRNLSKAMGLVLAGYGLGGLLLPVIVSLIEDYHWRTTFLIMGFATWLVILPSSLVLRHRPESYGYRVDGLVGQEQMPADDLSLPTGPDREFSVGTALRQGSFWLITITMTVFFMVLNGITLHSIPYLLERKFTSGHAALIAMAIPLTSIPGRLLFGWLGDLANKRFLLAAAIISMALGQYFFYLGDAIWQYLVFLLLFGLGSGGMLTIRGSMVREYFGRQSFGTIHGAMIGVMTVGGIIGPALAGWVVDLQGSYRPAWLGFMLATLATAPLALIMGAPGGLQGIDETASED